MSRLATRMRRVRCSSSERSLPANGCARGHLRRSSFTSSRTQTPSASASASAFASTELKLLLGDGDSRFGDCRSRRCGDQHADRDSDFAAACCCSALAIALVGEYFVSTGDAERCWRSAVARRGLTSAAVGEAIRRASAASLISTTFVAQFGERRE